MSVQVKSLTLANGPTIDGAQSAPAGEVFNVIPGATSASIYDLYRAPEIPADTINRAAIVKSIRIMNTHATLDASFTLYFNRPNASDLYRRVLLSPPDVVLRPGFSYVDTIEVVLEPGDKIQAKASLPNVVQYLISGVERDLT